MTYDIPTLQTIVIGQIVQDPAIIDERSISADIFTGRRREAFETVSRLWATGSFKDTCDLQPALLQEFGREAMEYLTNTVPPSAEYYLEQLREETSRQRLTTGL